MSDILTYTLSLQDQMSGTLKKIGINSESALNKFSNLQRKSNEIQEQFRSMGTSVGTLKQKLDLLRSEKEWIPASNIKSIKRYNIEIQKLESSINRLENIGTGSNWFKDAFTQVPFAELLTNPLVLAGAAAGNAIRLGIQQDLTNTSFKVLLNSDDSAKQMVADITKYGAETPYDKMGLADNAKTMLSFGLDANSIMPNLRAIGDIAMGDANKMNSLTLAFSQMTSTGKLNGQDLLQMINAGFNPLNEISKLTGKSIGELKDDMAKGEISAQMVTDAFRSAAAEGGQFHNMAEAMGQTLGGKLAQFMDNINEKFLYLYEIIQPVVIKGVEFADILVSGIAGGITGFVNKIKEGNPYALTFLGIIGSITIALGIMKLATIVQAGWTAALTLATNLSTKAWWANNAAMLANPVTWIIASIVALIALIALLIYKVDGWGKAWEYTVKAVKALWSGYISYIKLGWMIAENILLTGIDKIKIGWYSLKKLWDEDSANAALNQINAQSLARKKAMAEESSNMVNYAVSAWDYTKKAAGSLSINNKGFGDVKKDLESKLGISTPKGVAGTAGIGAAGKSEKGKSGKGAKTNSSIATGGQKTNYITITMKDLIGILNINGRDFKDSTDQMTEQTADALLRLLAMANATGG